MRPVVVALALLGLATACGGSTSLHAESTPTQAPTQVSIRTTWYNETSRGVACKASFAVEVVGSNNESYKAAFGLLSTQGGKSVVTPLTVRVVPNDGRTETDELAVPAQGLKGIQVTINDPTGSYSYREVFDFSCPTDSLTGTTVRPVKLVRGKQM